MGANKNIWRRCNDVTDAYDELSSKRDAGQDVPKRVSDTPWRTPPQQTVTSGPQAVANISDVPLRSGKKMFRRT